MGKHMFEGQGKIIKEKRNIVKIKINLQEN